MRFLLGPTVSVGVLAIGVLAMGVLAGCDPRKPPSTTGPQAVRPVPVPRPKVDAPADPRAAIVLTPAAVTQLRAMMRENRTPYLRIRASENSGYKLDLDPDTDPTQDTLTNFQGIDIVVDRTSASLMPPKLRVDYIEVDGEKGFKITAVSPPPGPLDTAVSLAEARKGFQTKLTRKQADKTPAAVPPPALFLKVRYDAPSGPSSANVTPDPKDGKKHPAIVWITGGDCNSIDAGCWKDANAANDQSASAYRKAGLMMMFPSLRGGNDSPGVKEGFLGEVEDVIAAGEYLRKQPYVDPERIYLGGHSTGGTLVLLASECTDRFRAVFSFGPVGDVSGYGPEFCPFRVSDAKEVNLRSPGRWLHSISKPTFVIEGAASGNASELRTMSRASKNADAHFFEVAKTDHFGILAPVNRLIAEKIRKDLGPTCDLAFTDDELAGLFRR